MSKINPKTAKPAVKAEAAPVAASAVKPLPDNMSANLAIAALVLVASIFVLWLVAYMVQAGYNPDTEAMKKDVVPLSIFPAGDFQPEPVERLQFQLTLLGMPLLSFLFYKLFGRQRAYFLERPGLCKGIVIACFGGLLAYLSILMGAPLWQIKLAGQKNSYFVDDLLIGKFTIPAVILYMALCYAYLAAKNMSPARHITIAIRLLCFGVVGYVLYDVVLYNMFPLGGQPWGTTMETNALFYSVTQVVAGKSLLVDFNAQYGLYAWMLKPWFGMIGLSTNHFTTTMAMLNAVSYLCLYLGLRKLIKGDIFSLMVFLCVVFWQYWHKRVAIAEASNPDYYYQYWPTRLLFPCLIFFLFISYYKSAAKWQRYLLPVLTLSAAFGVLWNLDSGIVAYGAAGVGLIMLAIQTTDNTRAAVQKSIYYIVWMGASLLVALALFYLTTRMHAGTWPDISRFTAFQKMFYISGFFMLPMIALHFWNIPAMLYLAGCIYCLFNLRKSTGTDVPGVAFLIILGMGLFAYFQGRSYGLTVLLVMYPAIIIAGVLCSKVTLAGAGLRLRPHVVAIAMFMPFLFLADGALSMVYYMPDVHAAAVANATASVPQTEERVKLANAFLDKHLKARDSVIILAKDYESYYYANGNYYNPMNVAGSSEIFLQTELGVMLNAIKAAKYPVIYDAMHIWQNTDTLTIELSKHYDIADMLPDMSMIYLTPLKTERLPQLKRDAHTLYFDYMGDFRKYNTVFYQMELPDTFSVELVLSFDPAKVTPGELVFSNRDAKGPYSGMMMLQSGTDMRRFAFVYGDGKTLSNGIEFVLEPHVDNHVVVKVRRDKLMVYNGDKLTGTVPVNAKYKNSQGTFFVNGKFSGKVKEVMISGN